MSEYAIVLFGDEKIVNNIINTVKHDYCHLFKISSQKTRPVFFFATERRCLPGIKYEAKIECVEEDSMLEKWLMNFFTDARLQFGFCRCG